MTFEAPAWPPFETEQIVLGSPESCVAVCCLWADRRRLARALAPGLYAALGNLYSSGGISVLVRNLLANPRLRYLVVCGTDLTNSGSSLVAFFERGVDAAHRIAGTAVDIDPHIPRQAIDELRSRVALVDLRGVNDPARLAPELQSLPPLPPQGEPILLPETPPLVSRLPSEGSGFLVRQSTTAKAWLDALKLAIEFGDDVTTTAATPFKAIVGLVVSASERPDQPFLPSWLPVSRDEIERQAEYLWNQLGLAERHAETTAGEAATSARSVFARVLEPAPASSSLAPVRCSGVLKDAELVLFAAYVELDLWQGFLPALLGLRLAQARLAGQLGLGLGPLLATVETARLDAEDEASAATLLADRYPRLLPWQVDPRGIFQVSLAGGHIVVEHGVLDLGKTGRRYSGTSAQRLYKAIVNDKLVLLPDHAAYLGAELQKAELALQLGLPYEQDVALDLSSLRASPLSPGGAGEATASSQ